MHSSFQGLSACYKAPEAEKLFATTKPVETRSDAFADDLEKVASALSSYAATVKPLATRLGNLKDEAIAFVSSVEGDDHWRRDQKKVDHNNNLWNSVNATVAAFHDAERACHDKIVALVNGTPLIPDDGTHKQNMYGYRASDLAHAEKTPWGSKANREYTGLAWLGHQVKSFVWDGFIVDGVWGTVKGLGTLVGTEGWDKAGQAWTGLGKLATGLVISASPLGTAFWTLPDDKLPRWVRDSRTTVKETGKALVAYDQWGKNPARAAGGVSFNVLTTVFTGGSGAAAKGGALARTASVLGKAGRVVDPMTYVGKAAKFGYVKVGDLMSGLKNLRAGSTFHLADEAFKLPGETATSVLPKRPAGLPEDVATFLDHNDKPVYMDKKTGALYDEHGKELQPAKDVKKELSAEERAAEATSHRPEARARQDDALVTAGVRNGGGEATASAGGHGGAGSLAPGGGATGHAPGGAAHGLGRGPSASHASHGGIPERGGLPERGGIPERGGMSHGADNSTDATRPRGTGTGDVHGAGHAAGSGAHDAGHATDHGVGNGAESGSHASGPGRGDSGTGSGHGSHETGNGHSGTHNPYAGMTDPEDIMRKQVDRANNEDGYFERYYKKNGNRIRLSRYDESGRVPPQLVWDSAKNKWVSLSDAPPPLPEKYLGEPLSRGRETATSEAVSALDDASRTRQSAISADKLAEEQLKHAREAFKADGGPANEAAVHAAEAAHKPLHRHMSEASEAYGEAIAQHHVIPEHYPNATKETLDGPLNGNDQFDQVWLREDGGYVVVEAKSSTRTDLGARNLPSGRRVMQGTREYFMDIIREMTDRGRNNANELRLAEALEEALEEGKLDYILVQGNLNTGQYAGYTMKTFDIR
ncbi:hypothetical protein LE181_18225 [Streptomyces sp. SCA3-4]|uniref:hypothetical protein n=1 Tax=Streptomyces sichuanensis TaxID=2871810 RepID=UPI001CE3479D|nr:hypothetical protein [Streptomyces sichuanensis]MCA6094091.1 hypothetical protein [Streptomyces sichuanensis]